MDAKEWVGESLLVLCTVSEVPLPQKDERECLPLWSGSMKVKNDPLRSENTAWLEEQEDVLISALMLGRNNTSLPLV